VAVIGLSTIFSLVIDFVFLTYGSRLLCDSAINLARRFNLNSIAVGIFLVSIGTSAPDFVSVITAALRGHSDFAIGNILGSNFSNLTLGFGIAAMISPFKCAKKIVKIELPLLFALTVFFAACCMDERLTRADGAMLLTIFAVYLFFLFSGKRPKFTAMESGESNCDRRVWPLWKSVVVFASAAILLACGAHLVVIHCIKIANLFEMSQTFIGFSLSALGTSAPEIFVVATAAKRRHHIICAGNIFGSSLINLMFVAGFCAVAHPMYLQGKNFIAEACVLIFVTAMAWYVFGSKRVFSKPLGALFIATYFAAMFFVKK
jgi:cation:H+ antiporter